MIYTNFIELYCLMLHAKFQNHRPSGSGEEDFLKVFAIYSHGGHPGHVTLTIYINFHCPFLTMLHIKFGSDRPSHFREDYYGHIHVYSLGARADKPLGTNCFHKHKIFRPFAHFVQVLPFKSYFNNFPIQMHELPMLTLP